MTREVEKLFFIPFQKVPGTTLCDEHNTIVPITHTSKNLLRIQLKRMQNIAEGEFAEEQMCFLRKVGTTEQILNIRIIMEKACEYNVSLYISFNDYSKAFDYVEL